MAKENPAIAEALKVLKELSGDEKMQRMAMKTEQNRRDIDDQLWGAKLEGKQEGRLEGKLEMVRDLIKTTSLSLDIIANAAGLPLDVLKRELNIVRQDSLTP